MDKILGKLTESQKRKVIELLGQVDFIFEEINEEFGDFEDVYHGTEFYNGLYEIMYKLDQWC